MEKYSLWNMFRDTLHYVRPYKWKYLIAIFFRVTSDVANLFPAFAMSTIVTVLTGPIDGRTWDNLVPVMVMWIFVLYYYRVGHDLAKFFGYRVSWYAGLDAKYHALRHMYQLDLSWHELENSGNKIKRIDNAKTAIKQNLDTVINVIIEVTVNFVGIAIIFSQADPRITLILGIYVVIFFIISHFLSKIVSKRYKPISKEEENYEGLSFESVNNIRTVKMLLLYSAVSVRIKNSLVDLKKYISKFIFASRARNHILDILTRIMEWGITFYLIYQITQGVESIGLLVLFRGLFWKVIEAIWEFSDVYNDWMIYKIYMGRFRVLMDEKPTIEKQIDQKNFPPDWKEIRFRNLSFSYAEKQVLKDLNLTVKKGEKVGIVGISGAGKSTFVKLVLDLYEDYTGSITFDHLSLKDIKREDYIDYVSAVSQDTELFNASLKENILIGVFPAGKIKESDLLKACTAANLNDVIAKLPNGLETIIGEKGFKLSGGERQRVGIARAIIRNPQIIVLDEATSHLDSESEQKIQSALDDLFSGVTAIVIAHRLSTLSKMDRIIVLDNGEIIEEGTMDELIKQGGKFTYFWKKQNEIL